MDEVRLVLTRLPCTAVCTPSYVQELLQIVTIVDYYYLGVLVANLNDILMSVLVCIIVHAEGRT